MRRQRRRDRDVWEVAAMRDEIRDVLDEQTPGERNALFRDAVWHAVTVHLATGAVVAVPTQGEQQARTLRAVDEIIRRQTWQRQPA